MNSQRQTNTFSKGMIKDLDYSSIGEGQYLHAENIRVVTNEASSSSAIQNIEGLEQVLSSSTFGSEEIIHTDTIRDLAIVFTKGTSGSSTTFNVYKLDFSAGDTPTVEKIVDSFVVEDGSLDNKISSVCRWESDDIVKIYWADGVNHLRMMNIMSPDNYTSMDDFETIPLGTLPPLEFKGYTAGSLEAGKYQFCYQLYNMRGTETSISAMSVIIPATRYDGTSNSSEITGSSQGDNTGRGIQLRANVVNSTFNRARLYSLFYSSNTEVPVINMIDDIEYDGSVLTYNVTGNNTVTELTVDELNALTSYVFVPKVLESKDNILFAADITEDTWDIPFEEYDTRAYRFNPDGTTQLNSATGQDSIVIDYSDLTTTDVPETHDCLNNYNQAEGYRNNCYMRFNGNWVYGGRGKNIEFRLLKATLIEDSSALGSTSSVLGYCPTEDFSLNASPSTYYQVQVAYVDEDGNTISAGSVELNDTNSKILNYANPEIASKFVGYQHDETYRFGIIFYNKYAIASPVHWICDIRMPKASDAGWEISSQSSSVSLAVHPIGIEFEVNNLPDEVYAYEIVRCERTSSDRRVVAQGIVTQVTNYNNAGAELYALPYMSYADFHKYIGIVDGYEFEFPMSDYSSGSYFTIASPDIAINRENITEILEGVTQIEGLYRLNSQVSPASTPADDAVLNPTAKIFCVNTVGMEGTGDNYVNRSDYDYAPYTGWVSSTNWLIFGEDMFYDAIVAKYYLKSDDSGSVGTADIDDITLANLTETFDIGESAFKNKGTVIGGNTYYNWIWDCYDTDVDEDANNTRKAGPGGVCAVFRSDNMLDENPLTVVERPSQINEVLLANLIRAATPYGGETYSLRQNNTYMSIGAYKDASDSDNTIAVFGGDTYTCAFDYAHCMFVFSMEDYQAENHNRLYSGAYFAVESTANIALRSDDISVSKTADEPVAGYANHFVQNDIIQIGDYYSQGEPLYAYFDAYSAEGNARIYTASSIYSIDDLHTDVRIMASETKTNNEVTDSWTQFKVANYIDLDTRFGCINAMRTINNILYFWQTDAFGQVAVNERSLITDNNVGALTLGTGDVLARYDYHTMWNGLHETHTDAITFSDSTIYWWDYDRCEICAFTGSNNSLAKVRGMQSWLRTNKSGFTKDPYLIYDKKYNEVLFEFDDTLLAYNEQISAFTSFYTIDSTYWIDFTDRLYLFSDSNLYKYNAGDTTDLLNDSKVSQIDFVVNQNFIYTKVFDNIEYFGEFTYGTNFENIYFQTKLHTSEVTEPENIDFREDTYMFAIPRVAEEVSESDMSLEPRMKGHYLISHYTYDCNGGNTFKVPYISTAYRISLI